MAKNRSQRRGAPRRGRPAGPRSNGLRVVLIVLGLGLAALVGVNLWVQHQPPQADAGAVHADILAGRSGAEVTFAANVISEPVDSGGHERIIVRDQLGDTLELDYNLSLGRPVPVHTGDSVVVHGQLYIDPGLTGVHCLHSQTSRGCPEQGWIQFRGATYS